MSMSPTPMSCSPLSSLPPVVIQQTAPLPNISRLTIKASARKTQSARPAQGPEWKEPSMAETVRFYDGPEWSPTARRIQPIVNCGLNITC